MNVGYNNRKRLKKSLPEVVDKFYTAAVLQNIARIHIYPMLKKDIPHKWPIKALLVEEVLGVLNNKEQMKVLMATLSSELKQLLMILVWDGDTALTSLNKELPFKVVNKSEKIHGAYYKSVTYTMLPGFTWIAIVDRDGFYRDTEAILCLPPAIRTLFRKYLPKPEGYYLSYLDKPSSDYLCYKCDDVLSTDLRVLSDYIKRGHLKFIKNGKIRKGCVRELDNLTEGGEFFPDHTDSQKLLFVRHELLATYLSILEPGQLEIILERSKDFTGVIKVLPALLLSDPELILKTILSHIKGADDLFYRGNYLVLQKLFKQIKESKWITFDNLKKSVLFRDLDLFPKFEDRAYITINPYEESYYSERLYINRLSDYAFHEVVTIPLLKGCLFLMATFGLAEISYTEPINKNYNVKSEKFLTPYDGLKAFRLTSLGAFAFGLTDKLDINISESKTTEIILNSERLTAICRNVDPITEKSLLEFMEKVSAECYRMTKQSFLKKCSTSAEVKRHVSKFYSVICANPPVFWIQFLESTQKNLVAMRLKSEYVVFELLDTPEIRHLFLSDPVLRTKSIKVEGVRIAIKKTDLKTVSRRLNKFGYLTE
jgi:hypothetical protein